MILRQVLTVAQMQAAEQAIFDTGTSVSELMETAARGASSWVRRIAGQRPVTVLCGPGNNGGDGYVIARRLRALGGAVQVVAPMEPTTEAAQLARAKWDGEVLTSGDGSKGDVLVDCLFGSGLSRPLSGEHAVLLLDLADRHHTRIALDMPSGIESDTGVLLNDRLPVFDVTLALGAWKFAHWRSSARGHMGLKRLVPIGIAPVEGAAQLIAKPHFTPPPMDAHKYTRGLCAVVAGEMPGAAMLSAKAAMRVGAGYVKLIGDGSQAFAPPDLVTVQGEVSEVLADGRIKAILIGPGLGRSEVAETHLREALSLGLPSVVDADALHLLSPDMLNDDQAILATPHDGELDALCRRFSVLAEGRQARAAALAKVSGMVVCAKGPDTVVAAPDGRIALAPPAPTWLSVAGSGDVLAGIAVSRMATGSDPFASACEAVWLHGEAARLCGAAFTASDLADAVSRAYSACL
ncbi:MAG: NAD(P)H-hydrate dehydratase [Pseudomonadota bacterium]